MSLFSTSPNQDEIKEYVPFIHRNMAGKTLEPYLLLAENRDVAPCLGPFYTEIQSQLASDTLTAANEAALPHIKRAVAWFAAARALPQLRISVADMGVQQHYSDNHVSQPVTAEQFSTAKWDIHRTAWDMLEYLLWDFLYLKRTAYPTWWNWEGSKKVCDLFLMSPSVFMEHHTLATPGALETWFKLRPIMRRVEMSCILPILCEDLYNELKFQICEDALTEANANLLIYVRDAVAALTLERGKRELGLQLTARGAKVVTPIEGHKKQRNGNYNEYQYAHLSDKNFEHGSITRLRAYLAENEKSFLIWSESPCHPDYVAPESEDETDCCVSSCVVCGCVGAACSCVSESGIINTSGLVVV